MATIKSYTDLKQSKKLAEILPIESADMCLTFVNNVWNPVWGKADNIYQLQKDCYEPDYTKDDYIDIDEFEPKVVPSWSLAALLKMLKDYQLFSNGLIVYIDNESYKIDSDNPVDACVAMIEKLHKQKLI